MRNLKGDLSQMYTQMDYLKRRGFKVVVEGGVPCVEQSSYLDAIKAIYRGYVDGWWNYKDDYIENDICTEEEFIARL
jgi:hypothetical protein